MTVNTISIDIAKTVFHLLIVNSENQQVYNQKLTRNRLVSFMATQPVSNVIMEACYSSHYWGRAFENMGHKVKLIPAQHVTPFVRGNKTDRNDALAIFEASQRPNIKTVPVKTEHRQAILALHKSRERLIKQKVQLTNQIRGILSDFGIVFSLGKRSLEQGLSDTSNRHRSQACKTNVGTLTKR